MKKPASQSRARSARRFRADRLNRILEKSLEPAARARGFARAELLTRWHEIAGEDLARRCRPVALKFARNAATGTLVLKVAPGAAPEVQHRSTAILERVNRYFGYRAVGRLTLEQGPLPQADSAPAPADPPPDPAAERDLQSRTAPVANEALQSALRRLGRHFLPRS